MFISIEKLRFLLCHNDHLSPTTGKFLKLEKDDEREKRRKMVETRLINPMSETLSQVKIMSAAVQYMRIRHRIQRLVLYCNNVVSTYTARTCKGCCSMPQARLKLASGQEARVKSW